MSRMARNSSPTSAPSSPKSPRVGFAEGYVTGISRPLSNSEHWTLYYFETHATSCKQCFEPLNVSKLGRQLCEEGSELAVDVARLIFRRKDGAVYSREKEGTKEIRVELPHDYVHTLGLLKAIQRALMKGQLFIKPKSHDRSYYVSERRPRTPEAMPRYEVRDATPSPERAHSGRGSLYPRDALDIERAKQAARATFRYNVELREPAHLRSHRRFSTYS